MIYQPLLDDIVNGKCLPVIGAGFSKNITLTNGREMPDWNQLASHINTVWATGKTEPMEILQEFEKQFGRTKLIEEIGRIIPLTGTILGEVHKYFVKIPSFDLIYTTNFDSLLEDAFRQETKRNCKFLVGEKQLAGYEGLPTVNIVKMHGDLSHSEYLVLTKKDYDDYMKNYPVIATHLSASLITRTPLFIGYSLTDPNFLQIKRIIRDRLGEFTRRGYIVLFDASPQDIAEYDKLHLSAINLETGNKSRSEVLLEFLKEICTYATTYSIKNASQSDSDLEEIMESETPNLMRSDISPSSDVSLSAMIRSVATIETELRRVLENRGVTSKDLKKSLTSLGSMAFKMGLLSSGDIGLIKDIMGVRNEVIHGGKNISDDQAKWIINSVDDIRKKISDIKSVTPAITSFTVDVDSMTYTDGDIMTITGKVVPVINNMPITIQILDPEGSLILVKQYDVDDNGRCIMVVQMLGGLWDLDGKYTVRAQYGSATTIAETEFNFKHRISRISDIFPILYNNKIFEVKYSIRGGTLRHIEVDQNAKSLLAYIESNQDGYVTLEIPRNLIDSKMYDDNDDKFLVMIDGAEVSYSESKTPDSRILTVQFLKDDSSIEIFGSRLPPLERITFSNLRILDENKKSLNDILINQSVLISASLLNNQNNVQKYTFIVQIQRKGVTIDNMWVDGVLKAWEPFEPTIVWKSKDYGEFDVHAFVWENIENPNALASPLHIKINVQNVSKENSIKQTYGIDKIISNLDTIIETYSGFPPTKSQLNDAIKQYDVCWQWAKENISIKKYEINLLKTKPVSILRLIAAPNPSKELRATTDELIIKAKRLRKIIVQDKN